MRDVVALLRGDSSNLLLLSIGGVRHVVGSAILDYRLTSGVIRGREGQGLCKMLR